MAEQLDLTTPVASTGGTSFWTVDSLHLFKNKEIISIVLEGENGERLTLGYTGQVATDLMIFLNKANLSVKSLHKRLLEKLVADGKLDGTVSGVPESIPILISPGQGGLAISGQILTEVHD